MLSFFKKYTIALLSFALVAYLSFANFSNISEIPSVNFLAPDKLAHFLMYFYLMATILYPLRKTLLSSWKIFLISIIPISFGAIVEFLQEALTLYRSKELLDFISDVIGVYTAIIVFYFKRIFFISK